MQNGRKFFKTVNNHAHFPYNGNLRKYEICYKPVTTEANLLKIYVCNNSLARSTIIKIVCENGRGTAHLWLIKFVSVTALPISTKHS